MTISCCGWSCACRVWRGYPCAAVVGPTTRGTDATAPRVILPKLLKPALAGLPRSGGGDDDLHAAVLRLALRGQVRGDGLILAAAEGVDPRCLNATAQQHIGHGIGPA